MYGVKRPGPEPTYEHVNSLIRLDRKTGFLYRRVDRRRWKAGTRVGYPHDEFGYRYVLIDGRQYKEHRVVWLLKHKKWPDSEVDHKNGIKYDNRPSNLREGDKVGNGHNRGKANKNSRTGVLGVYVRKDGRYVARLTERGGKQHKRTCATMEDAKQVYKQMKRQYQPFWHESNTLTERAEQW